MKKQDDSNQYEIKINKSNPNYSLQSRSQDAVDAIEPAVSGGHDEESCLNANSDCMKLHNNQAPVVENPQRIFGTKFSSMRNKMFYSSDSSKCSRATSKINIFNKLYHVREFPLVHEARNSVLPQNDVDGVHLTRFKDCSRINKFPADSSSGINFKCEILNNSDAENLYSTTTFIDSPSNDLMCRICHEDDREEKFISPCKCSGTLGLVHKSCLEKWLGSNEGRQNKCELCNSIIPVERIPRPFCEYFKGNKNRRWSLWTDLFFIFFWIPMVVMCNIYNIQLNNERSATTSRDNVTDPATITYFNDRIGYFKKTREMRMKEFEDVKITKENIELILFNLFTFVVQTILVGWILFSLWENVRNFITWRKNNCIVRLHLREDIN